MPYYNTTGSTGEELSEAKKKAATQNAIVLSFFRRRTKGKFTPAHVWKAVAPKGVPLTSIRRSITNLTKTGWLLKTATKRIGEYGVKNFCWAWNPANEEDAP